MAAISTGLTSAAYAAELVAINKRKFYPKTYAEGGMVYGPSHEQGGVPFTVQGQGGYEMEGGEYIVNKESTKKYKHLLDQINGIPQASQYHFATGGVVTAQQGANRQLELLEAIAEATTGTAINTSKPVRSFVSSQDLRTDDNARRIKERNTTL